MQSHKYLPFGYGPGKTTVIEEAASFDDDEEDYGDYQVSYTYLLSMFPSLDFNGERGWE